MKLFHVCRTPFLEVCNTSKLAGCAAVAKLSVLVSTVSLSCVFCLFDRF